MSRRSVYGKASNKPWSKLQRELYKLIDSGLDFQIHCVAYPMRANYGNNHLPRYWITLNTETIWDYPKQFLSAGGHVKNLSGAEGQYPYLADVSKISNLLREYIDTPKDELFSKVFENDHWGLVNILRAADRRTGKRRLDTLKKKTHNLAAHKVMAARKYPRSES